MRRRPAQTITFALAGALAAAALLRGFPSVRIPPAGGEVASRPRPASTAEPSWRERVDTLRRGETLSDLLQRGGVRGANAASVLGAATAIDARRVRAGMPVTLRSRAPDSLPAEIIFQLAVDRVVHLRRTVSGWSSADVRLPWRRDTLVVAGVIASNLYEAIDSSAAAALPAAARAELAWSLADVYEYRVDMSRELRRDDAFRVLFVRAVGPAGAVRVETILAARFELSGDTIEAVRYGAARGEYFDQHGKSMRAAFLRAPLEFRRISSVFGRRRHPILRTWRAHTGTDYAAGAGTPVRSVGDGVVIFAGRKGGYGNAVEVRHRNGFVTRYGHLRGFAAGARRGKTVGIGQTIGYVGATGLATGPHLHFEVLVNGAHRDPRRALDVKGGEPLPVAERARFEGVRGTLLAALDREPRGDPHRVALR